MKRVLLTVAVALLIPSILMAAPVTLGVYFEGSLAYTPQSPSTTFLGGLYIVQSDYYVTGVEYQSVQAGLQSGSDHPGHIRPITHCDIGDPFGGHSVTLLAASYRLSLTAMISL